MTTLTGLPRTRPASDYPEIEELLSRIDKVYDPVEVILHGSHARDEATDQSDWDLKIVVRDDAPESLLCLMLGWRTQEGSGVFGDLTCARLSEFIADLGVANSAASEVAIDGVVLVSASPPKAQA